MHFGTHLFEVIQKSSAHNPGQLPMDKTIQDQAVLLERGGDPADIQRSLPISTTP